MAENSEKTNMLEAKDYYDKGILCFKSSNYNEAIENFSSCIAVDPTWPDAWEALADSYFELRNYKAAFEIYKREEYFYYAAMCKYKLHKYKEALSFINETDLTALNCRRLRIEICKKLNLVEMINADLNWVSERYRKHMTAMVTLKWSYRQSEVNSYLSTIENLHELTDSEIDELAIDFLVKLKLSEISKQVDWDSQHTSRYKEHITVS